jgi:hypothetical protein
MFFPPAPIDNVYIVFQLSHTHLEIQVTAQNIDTIGRKIKEGNDAGMGRICVPLSEIKYFLQKTKNSMMLVFKDGEKLEVICTMEEILKVLGQSKLVKNGVFNEEV